ncbi:hypothetical protein GQ600_5034 [Phytophthora cactorum]|nr:hypothetical protein GQ600_5034 [Phytophthora cactorum]
MASESAPPNHSELPAESLDIENDDENDQVDPQLLSQRLGYLLQTVIMSKDVSPSCLAALGRMADHGEILDAAFVQEIKRTGALLNSVMSLNLIELLNYIEEHHIATDMSRFLNGVRSIYDVVSINVVQVVQNAAISRGLMIDLAMWLLIAAIGAVYLSCIWFACSGRHLHRRDEEIRQGHEADTWAELATTQEKRVAMFTYVITACLTIYLPLTRLCLEIVAESAAHLLFTNGTQYSEENSAFRVSNGALTNSGSVGTSASELVVARFKNDDTSWVAIAASAVILLATFTLPLPRLLIRAIAQNRPTGSLENSKVTYDLDGEEVYERLVQRDPNQLRCPYRSLCAGFEQRWSYYKVMQLVVKLCLALIIVFVASDNTVLRAIILCAFYACVVALSSYSTPFIDPLNNLMEISGKLTALVPCIGGLVAVTSDMKQNKSTAHIVNFFVMLVILLLGMLLLGFWIKNFLGWITFSDTCRGIDNGSTKNVLPLWDLEREVKHRVWHGFWRALMLEVAQETRIIKAEPQGMNLVDRFTALEQAIVASGIHRVRDHWQGEEDAHNATNLRSALEGVDVYWDDATGTRDGHLDSKTCFGKMYVVPYPFHCVVVYDDCKDETIIRDDKDAPYTGMVYEQSGRVAVMDKSHIGLTSTMTESSELRKIFTQTQEDKHAQANATLTDAFWYFVYNNANLSREKLEEHFKRRELNPRLKLLAATHQVALDSLYLHLFSHTFWHISGMMYTFGMLR